MTERYEPKRVEDDAAVADGASPDLEGSPAVGYRRAHVLLVKEGWEVDRKRVQRLWREEGLRVPQKRRKRRRLGGSTARRAPGGRARESRVAVD